MMETILKIAGGLLGILVPFLFIMTLTKGIRRSNLDEEKKQKLSRRVAVTVALFTFLVWILSLSEILDYHAGDLVPRYFVPLLVFVLTGLCLLASRNFQAVLSSTPLSALVGAQVFRLAGVAFFVIAYLQILPGSFTLAGYGDLLTGILAIAASKAIQNKSANAKWLFWLFNIAGLFDLMNVAVMLLAYYPLWYNSSPTSENASHFSLVMIPAVAAPIAMLLHIYSIVNAIRLKQV
jgi:hypothetical protein